MKYVIILISLFVLSSCTDKATFSCPPMKPGQKVNKPECLTIEESDKRAGIKANDNQIIKDKMKGEIVNDNAFDTFTTTRIIPTRSEEKIGKIWFAPSFDEEGNFYDESYVYVILKPAKWQFKSK